MDRSSNSSAVFNCPNEEVGNTAFTIQLNKTCRRVSALETNIQKQDYEDGGLEDSHDMTQWL
jgi:hypothetical protein